MLIAHFPAGYLASQLFADRPRKAAVMIGSILPDLDLLYFYTLGGRAVVHHHYWPHKPFFWLCLLGALAALSLLLRWRAEKCIATLALGILIHLSLDSLTGSVFWLWPFNDAPVTLVAVPAIYASWQMNFILHWTFIAEIAIILAAAIVFAGNRRNRKDNATES